VTIPLLASTRRIRWPIESAISRFPFESRTTLEGVTGAAVAAQPGSPGLQAVRARLSLSSGDAEGALAALAVRTDAAYPVVAVERKVLRALALRALGVVRGDMSLLEEAAAAFERMGLPALAREAAAASAARS